MSLWHFTYIINIFVSSCCITDPQRLNGNSPLGVSSRLNPGFLLKVLQSQNQECQPPCSSLEGFGKIGIKVHSFFSRPQFQSWYKVHVSWVAFLSSKQAVLLNLLNLSDLLVLSQPKKTQLLRGSLMGQTYFSCDQEINYFCKIPSQQSPALCIIKYQKDGKSFLGNVFGFLSPIFVYLSHTCIGGMLGYWTEIRKHLG